jgi:hypothetical protein
VPFAVEVRVLDAPRVAGMCQKRLLCAAIVSLTSCGGTEIGSSSSSHDGAAGDRTPLDGEAGDKIDHDASTDDASVGDEGAEGVVVGDAIHDGADASPDGGGSVTGLAVDHEGNLILAGYFHGTVVLAGESLTSVGNESFVAKYRPDGTPVWSVRFGETDPTAVAVDSSGSILLAGGVTGPLRLGNEDLAEVVGQEIFVAKLASDGKLRWSKRFRGASSEWASAVASDAVGNVIFTGVAGESTDFGGGSSGGDAMAEGEIVVAKLDPEGNHVWSKLFGSPVSRGNGVAVDSAGNIWATGSFYGSADFGGGPLGSPSYGRAFLVKLDPAGRHLRSEGFGDHATANGIAVDASDNVVITGAFQYGIDFGGGAFSSRPPPNAFAPSDNVFVAKLDAEGKHIFSGAYGDTTSHQQGHRVAFDGLGNTLMTVDFAGSVDLGAGRVMASQESRLFHTPPDTLLVRFDLQGRVLGAQAFAGATGTSVVANAQNHVLVGGSFRGDGLAGATLTLRLGVSAVLAEFSP